MTATADQVGSANRDVVVPVEYVFGIDASLHRDEPVPIGPVRRSDCASSLIGAEAVEPTSVDQVLGERRICRTRPTDVLLGIRRIDPDRWDQQIEALLRCGTAVSVVATRVTAPWKCSNRIAFIGEGVDANRSTARSMSSSESPPVKLDIQ
jgi:hypothetical protein